MNSIELAEQPIVLTAEQAEAFDDAVKLSSKLLEQLRLKRREKVRRRYPWRRPKPSMATVPANNQQSANGR